MPAATPLEEMARARLGAPVTAANDAQAAAWAEHMYGAGQGRDLVYLTISTGLGGGIIAGGRLVRGRGGLAGHVGQTRGPCAGARAEELLSGRWLAEAGGRAGRTGDAESIFRAASEGAPWALRLVETAAERTAMLCADLQMLLDPEVIVIGGGMGLAEGFLDRVRTVFAARALPPAPDLVAARLGAFAGVIGIAALACGDSPATEVSDTQ